MVELPTKKTVASVNPFLLNTLIYGRPKTGKSTFCVGLRKALILDLDNGYSAHEGYIVTPSTWAELEEYRNLILGGGHGFETIVLDNISDMVRLACDAVLNEHGFKSMEDKPYMKLWVFAAEKIRQFCLSLIHADNVGFFMVAHADYNEELDRAQLMPMLNAGNEDKKLRDFFLAKADNVLYFHANQVSEEAMEVEMYAKANFRAEAGNRHNVLPLKTILPADPKGAAAAYWQPYIQLAKQGDE